MAFLIGTDEAGYGPNLGPLIVSASVWRVPDVGCELYRELKSAVTKEVVRGQNRSRPRVPIADSKLLYKPGGGLEGLELPLFATLPQTGESLATWRACWRTLTTNQCDLIDKLPWYREFDRPLPTAADQEEIHASRARFTDCLAKRNIELVKVRSVAVFPERFNQLVDEFDSKGAALSTITLDLVAEMVAELKPEPIRVVCDKHGGRNSYAGFLQPRFDDQLVRVHRESRQESSYDIGTTAQPISISFRAKGESFLPSALASIASKYLRELAMMAFNSFWLDQNSGLRPTAGYPMDAKRFRIDVADEKRKLRILDDIFWRKR